MTLHAVTRACMQFLSLSEQLTRISQCLLKQNILISNLIEEELLAMVREVSQDKLYDTVEFNEFLTMIAMQKKHEVTHEDLVEAFK